MPAVIAFVSQKGGVGKSTLARALAAVCSHAGLDVILADLDPRQQTLVQWQKARTEHRVSPRLSVEPFDDAAAAAELASASESSWKPAFRSRALSWRSVESSMPRTKRRPGPTWTRPVTRYSRDPSRKASPIVSPIIADAHSPKPMNNRSMTAPTR